MFHSPQQQPAVRNPWRNRSIDLFRELLRLALWLCLVINGGIAAIFSIAFTYFFFLRLWGWAYRSLFQHPW